MGFKLFPNTFIGFSIRFIIGLTCYYCLLFALVGFMVFMVYYGFFLGYTLGLLCSFQGTRETFPGEPAGADISGTRGSFPGTFSGEPFPGLELSRGSIGAL